MILLSAALIWFPSLRVHKVLEHCQWTVKCKACAHQWYSGQTGVELLSQDSQSHINPLVLLLLEMVWLTTSLLCWVVIYITLASRLVVPFLSARGYETEHQLVHFHGLANFFFYTTPNTFSHRLACLPMLGVSNMDPDSSYYSRIVSMCPYR